MAKKEELVTVKVKPSTYRRLRLYQSRMELQDLERGKTVRYSMDDIINAMLNLLEMAEFRFAEGKRATQAPQR